MEISLPKTKQEYFSVLDKLKKILTVDNAKDINVFLDAMFKVKPVRIEWFLLKGRVMRLLAEDTSEIDSAVFYKYLFLQADNDIDELLEYLIEASEEDTLEKNRLILQQALKKSFVNQDNTAEKVIYETLNDFVLNLKAFLDDNLSETNILDLINASYVQCDYIAYAIFTVLYETRFKKKIEIREWLRDTSNFSYFIERLKMNKKTFTVIAEDYNMIICQAISKALTMLGHEVYFINNLENIEVDQELPVSETLSVSIENIQKEELYSIIYPVNLTYNGKNLGNNRANIVDYINRNFAKDKMSLVICSGTLFESLCKDSLLKKNFQRLYAFHSNYFEANLTLGWSGDYLSYISDIYKFDAHEVFEKESECDFSIVIPVRNSSDTFEYTLKTCLNLRYQGPYEIVVSDNSSKDNHFVKDVVDKLSDSRIVYYRTPQELPLTKNFEFAFLKAKGEFILSIGADDAILPWSLDILKMLLEKCPEENVIQWDRGFYAWPGFNGGQENQFIVPYNYDKKNIDIARVTSGSMLKAVLDNPQSMYALPLLYINSGFRRRYLKIMLEKTGSLWNAFSQDIYTGIVNLSINENILKIKYPLTIAGMSGNSIGASCNTGLAKVSQFIRRKKVSPNMCVRSELERIIPNVWNDIGTLNNALIRGIVKDILPKSYLTEFYDLKKMYRSQIELLRVDDLMYEDNVRQFLIAAKNVGGEFEAWCKNLTEEKLNVCIMYDNSKDEKPARTYSVGFTQSGGLILDASKFCVKNICDAVNLFENLTGM